MTKYANVEVSVQTVKTCLRKHRWNNWYKPLSKRGTHARIKHVWYAAELRGCPNEQNIAHQTREQKKCFTFLIECLIAFKFYQTRPNTIEHDQTRSNSTKQGVQTVKCLVTKQCLMVFGRQIFIVCPGPNTFFCKNSGYLICRVPAKHMCKKFITYFFCLIYYFSLYTTVHKYVKYIFICNLY